MIIRVSDMMILIAKTGKSAKRSRCSGMGKTN